MGEYDNPRDDPDSSRARREQEDPYVQHLVVLRDPPRPLAVMLAAAVQAVCRAQRFADDARYRDDYIAWSERSFRKVTLRAKASEWQRLSALDAAFGEVDGVAVVAALPPVRRSMRPALLEKLQAWTSPLESLPQAPPQPAGAAALTMDFVINGAVSMRAGKLAAQVAHAALLCCEGWSQRAPAPFAAWAEAGHPSRFFVAPPEAWAALKRSVPCAVIRDAGLTEVEPGSETVMALVPGHSPGALAPL
ncbi:MAG: hypothetical protein JNK72_17040 [Myxococcales bacterium]|nr:hypothetical protein [Myxococcales bacterium]